MLFSAFVEPNHLYYLLQVHGCSHDVKVVLPHTRTDNAITRWQTVRTNSWQIRRLVVYKATRNISQPSMYLPLLPLFFIPTQSRHSIRKCDLEWKISVLLHWIEYILREEWFGLFIINELFVGIFCYFYIIKLRRRLVWISPSKARKKARVRA